MKQAALGGPGVGGSRTAEEEARMVEEVRRYVPNVLIFLPVSAPRSYALCLHPGHMQGAIEGYPRA